MLLGRLHLVADTLIVSDTVHTFYRSSELSFYFFSSFYFCSLLPIYKVFFLFMYISLIHLNKILTKIRNRSIGTPKFSTYLLMYNNNDNRKCIFTIFLLLGYSLASTYSAYNLISFTIFFLSFFSSRSSAS